MTKKGESDANESFLIEQNDTTILFRLPNDDSCSDSEKSRDDLLPTQNPVHAREKMH